MRIIKLYFLIFDFLCYDVVVQYLDQEIFSGFGVRFCWLLCVENNYLIVYFDIE